MTKKDYIKIADIISNLFDEAPETIAELVDELSIMFENDNQKFDRSRFYNACGVIAPENVDENTIS